MPKVHELLQYLQENYAIDETVAFAVVGIDNVREECLEEVPDDVAEMVLDNLHLSADDILCAALPVAYRAIQN